MRKKEVAVAARPIEDGQPLTRPSRTKKVVVSAHEVKDTEKEVGFLRKPLRKKRHGTPALLIPPEEGTFPLERPVKRRYGQSVVVDTFEKK